MKKKRTIIVFVVIIVFLAFWFSDILPKQVVKIVAANYISKQENSDAYILSYVEYSPAHDCYFAYYREKNNPNGETRNIGVYYRWLPFYVYYDSAHPG